MGLFDPKNPKKPLFLSFFWVFWHFFDFFWHFLTFFDIFWHFFDKFVKNLWIFTFVFSLVESKSFLIHFDSRLKWIKKWSNLGSNLGSFWDPKKRIFGTPWDPKNTFLRTRKLVVWISIFGRGQDPFLNVIKLTGMSKSSRISTSLNYCSSPYSSQLIFNVYFFLKLEVWFTTGPGGTLNYNIRAATL